MNELGQFGASRTASSAAGGDRFRIIAQKGERTPRCPPGTQTESSGKLGTGQQYVWCYRQPAPVRQAPPPPAPRISVSVPTSVATQVSPQISPVMTQQQASPGASVAASPVSAPGPTSTGITAEQLKDIFRAQEATRQAELEAEREKRQQEIQSMQREMASRAAATQAIMDAERAEALEREASKTVSAQAPVYVPPPPPSMPVQAAPVETAPEAAMVEGEPQAADGPPWMLILLAAGGIGAFALMGKKKRR